MFTKESPIAFGFVLAALLSSACQRSAPPPPASHEDLLTPEQYAIIESEEAESQRGKEEAEPETPAAPDSPRIDIDQPDVSQPLIAPFAVRIRFQAAADARIDPGSFRVLYKTRFHNFDITERAREYIQVSPEGAVASEIPLKKAGKHTLVLEVSDTKKRIGRRNLRFEIAAG